MTERDARRLAPGDRVIVKGLPEDKVWLSSRGSFDLANGEILTLSDPCFYQSPCSDAFGFSYIAKIVGEGWIPFDWVEVYKKICRCDLWAGCTCGVFDEEMRARE